MGPVVLIAVYSLGLEGKGGTDSPADSVSLRGRQRCRWVSLCCLSGSSRVVLMTLLGQRQMCWEGGCLLAGLDTREARGWLQNMGQEANTHC